MVWRFLTGLGRTSVDSLPFPVDAGQMLCLPVVVSLYRIFSSGLQFEPLPGNDVSQVCQLM